MTLKIIDWGTLILKGQGKEEDPQRHQGGEGVESCGFLVCNKNFLKQQCLDFKGPFDNKILQFLQFPGEK